MENIKFKHVRFTDRGREIQLGWSELLQVTIAVVNKVTLKGQLQRIFYVYVGSLGEGQVRLFQIYSQPNSKRRKKNTFTMYVTNGKE